MKVFQIREKSRNLIWVRKTEKKKKKKKKKKKWQKSGKGRGISIKLAVSSIFRNINLQNWPRSFVEFYVLKINALLEDWVAEDSCKGSFEAVENVWKMVKSQGKVWEFWKSKRVTTLHIFLLLFQEHMRSHDAVKCLLCWTEAWEARYM